MHLFFDITCNHRLTADGSAEGDAVLEIPTGRDGVRESSRRERKSQRSQEERGNEEQTELPCHVTTRKVVIVHETNTYK